MNSILDDLKHTYKQGSILMKLIYINLALFIVVQIFFVFSALMQLEYLHDLPQNWLSVPSNIFSLLVKPWTLLTYMFFHTDFWHIFWNMLVLFFIGRVYESYLGQRRLLSTYILGGLFGAICYILAYNLFPLFSEAIEFSKALGASGAVYAIMVGMAVHNPNYKFHLFGILELKLKYIVLFLIIKDFISIPYENPGGHIIHLGGAFLGYLDISRYRRGKDLSAWFYGWTSAVGNIFTRKSKMKVAYKRPKSDEDYNVEKKASQARIDRILDKINRSGYDSLSQDEKDDLFNASQR